MEKNGKKIGILGGTFNPPHNGHLAMAESACTEFSLDEVIFLPTGHTAYKEYSGEEMSEHRFRMVELMIADDPRFSVSREEMDFCGIGYTYQTLERLYRKMPEEKLYFILGGDSLRDFPTWRHPERILDHAVILAAARRELRGESYDRQIAEMRERFGGDIRFLDMPRFDSSSEEIRSRVKAGEDVRDVVPPVVADYIEQKNLYR